MKYKKSVKKLSEKLKQIENIYAELSKDVAEIKESIKPNLVDSKGYNSSELMNVDSEKVCGIKTLEVGKWYRGVRIKILFCFNGNYGNFTNYGFKSTNKWCEELGVHKTETYVLSTSEEVEKALIEEANRIGYKIGDKIKMSSDSEILTITSLNYSFDKYENILRVESNNPNLYFHLFYKGIWAEIIQEETPIKEEEVIDWNKPQLLISKENNKVISTTGRHQDGRFEALVVLSDSKVQPKNHFSIGWAKNSFKIFKGTLTNNKEQYGSKM